MTLGARIADFRRKKGVSLQKVADAVGVSKAHIWELEKENTKNPAMDLVRRLANYYNTSVSYLIGEDLEGSDDEHKLAGLFREARDLAPHELELLQNMMNTLLEQKKKKNQG